jgi:hypothetical protein
VPVPSSRKALGPEEGPGITDPSIFQSVMPHQVADDAAGADAGAGAGVGAAADADPGAGAGSAGNGPERHVLTHSPAACMLAGPMYLTLKQHHLGRVEYHCHSSCAASLAASRCSWCAGIAALRAWRRVGMASKRKYTTRKLQHLSPSQRTTSNTASRMSFEQRSLSLSLSLSFEQGMPRVAVRGV